MSPCLISSIISSLQIATLAVFCHFLSALFSRQFLVPNERIQDKIVFPNASSTIHYSARWPFTNHTPDFYVPVFTLIEFVCYMGWIKVAETLLNPFGDDDEDFNLSYLIDRNLQVKPFFISIRNDEIISNINALAQFINHSIFDNI